MGEDGAAVEFEYTGDSFGIFLEQKGGDAVPIDYGQSSVMDIVCAAVPDDAIACDWFYVAPAQVKGTATAATIGMDR